MLSVEAKPLIIHILHILRDNSLQFGQLHMTRAVAKTLIGVCLCVGGGGGRIFIYSSFAQKNSFQICQIEFDLKRNAL